MKIIFQFYKKLLILIYIKKFILFNNGDGIRDFIHVLDVEIYDQYWIQKFTKLLGSWSGSGISIKSILDYIKISKKKLYIKINIDETFSSIADVNWLNDINYNNKFELKLENFLQKKIKNFLRNI